MEPSIQYARAEDGVSIAYATEGEGPPLVIVPVPAVAHVQREWEMFPNLYPALARDFRLISYDPRGTGLSDRDAIDFSMEAMMRDFDAIVDRTGLQSFAVSAFQGAVSIAVTYAAKYPESVSHLILVDGWANWSDIAGMPAWEAFEALIDKDWTMFTETLAHVLAGMDDPRVTEGLGEYIRGCIEPEAYHALMAAQESWDVVGLLPRVRAQTLVLHNINDPLAPIRGGQKLAAGIPDARFLTIDDMNWERVPALTADFAGLAAAPPAVAPTGMVTILFTDMASSTTLADRFGDAAAQEVRRAHNEIVRTALSANGGSEIKHTGDGIMASFPTASAALDCAIAIQRGVAVHKDEHPDSPLGVYVGLNAGEPIAEDDPDGRVDLFGTSINLAARICDHAEAGQIVAADVVRQLTAGKDFLFADLGETELRGFEDPIKLWELRWKED